jgi:hypothetical protein
LGCVITIVLLSWAASDPQSRFCPPPDGAICARFVLARKFFFCPDYALDITRTKMVNKSRQAGDQASRGFPDGIPHLKRHLSAETVSVLDAILQPFCEAGAQRRLLISRIEELVLRDLSHSA